MEISSEIKCDVCLEEIVKLEDGFIWADDFLLILNLIKDNFSEEPDRVTDEYKNFIDAVRKAYSTQFKAQYKNPSVEQILSASENTKKKNEKFAYLLVHDKCVPSEASPLYYYIDLDSIDTQQKWKEWSEHLSEKNWFDEHAWENFSKKLFPKRVVYPIYE